MEFLVILVLTFINGIFALSEIALVSVRKQKMLRMAEEGNAQAKTVLELLKKPEGFLSAVQIGITLIGIVSGAYGGATLTDNVRPLIEEIEFLRPYAPQISYVLVVALITYLSIVIGELIPKTLAIKYAEPVALNIAGFIRLFSRIANPFVWLLTTTTKLVFKVFGIKPAEEEKITEEELRFFIKTAGRQGVLNKEESEIHDNVLSFGDVRVKNLMTHRLQVEWVDVGEPLEVIEQQLLASNHTLFPVAEESYDRILGYLQVKDFFVRQNEPGFSVRHILREPVFVMENHFAIDVLRQFKKRRCYFGIVIDEYGAFEGVVTLHDLSEALVGDLPYDDELDEPEITRRSDGSLLVSGSVFIDDLNRYLEMDIIPENSPFYSTLAGFVLFHLEQIPEEGDQFEYLGHRVEIVDKDGTRIDKILIHIAYPNATNPGEE